MKNFSDSSVSLDLTSTESFLLSPNFLYWIFQTYRADVNPNIRGTLRKFAPRRIRRFPVAQSPNFNRRVSSINIFTLEIFEETTGLGISRQVFLIHRTGDTTGGDQRRIKVKTFISRAKIFFDKEHLNLPPCKNSLKRQYFFTISRGGVLSFRFVSFRNSGRTLRYFHGAGRTY